MSEYNDITNAFYKITDEHISGTVYVPKNYPGPIAIDATLSKEAEEYLKNGKIQINMSDEMKLGITNE